MILVNIGIDCAGHPQKGQRRGTEVLEVRGEVSASLWVWLSGPAVRWDGDGFDLVRETLYSA
jgi:hypothetical protein